MLKEMSKMLSQLADEMIGIGTMNWAISILIIIMTLTINNNIWLYLILGYLILIQSIINYGQYLWNKERIHINHIKEYKE